jgi:hypothetical protein
MPSGWMNWLRNQHRQPERTNQTYATLEADKLLVDLAHTHRRLDEVLEGTLARDLCAALCVDDEVEQTVEERVHPAGTVRTSKLLVDTKHPLHKAAELAHDARVHAAAALLLHQTLQRLLEPLLCSDPLFVEVKRGVLELVDRLAELVEVRGRGEVSVRGDVLDTSNSSVQFTPPSFNNKTTNRSRYEPSSSAYCVVLIGRMIASVRLSAVRPRYFATATWRWKPGSAYASW